LRSVKAAEPSAPARSPRSPTKLDDLVFRNALVIFDQGVFISAMCYIVFFSTTSNEDFSKVPSEHFQIGRPDPKEDLSLLAYEHRWELLSRYGGCSCHYRHTIKELGFGPVVDWFPEDEDDVVATGGVYDFFTRLLSEGHRVDVVDLWTDTANEDVASVEVVLGALPRVHFRFLEAVKFAFTEAGTILAR